MAALEGHRSKVTAVFRDLFYTSDEELPSQVRPDLVTRFVVNAADLDVYRRNVATPAELVVAERCVVVPAHCEQIATVVQAYS